MKTLIITLALIFSAIQFIFAEEYNSLETSYSDSLILCLNIPNEQAPGSYCEDIMVFNFSDVQSLQFAIDYNVDKIKWDTAVQFNETAKISIYDTNLAEPGNFRISWAHPAGLSSFLEDEQVLFSVCYEVIETSSADDLFLSTNIPGGIEATNNDGQEIPLSFNCSIINNTLETNQSPISLYPNPVNSEISVNSDLNSTGKIEILDSYGRILATAVSHPGKTTTTISVSNLTTGSYFIRIHEDSNIHISKFIKI